MGIVKNYFVGTKEVTAVLMGKGDVHVNTVTSPVNVVYFAQHEAKPVEEWKLGEGYDYSKLHESLDTYSGDVVWMKFGRVESIDAVIETLLECRRRMVESQEFSQIMAESLRTDVDKEP